MVEQCNHCYQFHPLEWSYMNSPPPKKSPSKASSQPQFVSCHTCLGCHHTCHLQQPALPYIVKRNQAYNVGRSYVPSPTFGPHVNHLPVPHPSTTPVMFYSQLPNARMRSKSLVSTNRQGLIPSSRRNLQRQVSVDLTASGTIQEEMSSSTNSDDESINSFLSLKRASLKKKLRMLSTSEKATSMTSSTATLVTSMDVEKAPISLPSSPSRRVRVTCL